MGSESFLEFLRDQLGDIENVVTRAMFGGVGLYAGTVFFGIVHRDRVYFKVDDETRRTYERAGMGPFRPFADRAMTLQYYEVPAHVLEDAGELATWARRAIATAERAPLRPRRRLDRR